jgi:hypothetical protein
MGGEEPGKVIVVTGWLSLSGWLYNGFGDLLKNSFRRK